MERLNVIRQKLEELQRRDKQLTVFGASSHLYLFNKVKTGEQLQAFERIHGIRLPDDYRMFLSQIGNGGAGPYYGLEPLEHGLFDDLDHRHPDQTIDPSKPFPFTDAWNMKLPDGEADEGAHTNWEDEYFDTKWINGLLRISNFGCGVSMNLVVNGPEYGNIWVDDRGSDQGIYPDVYFGNTGRITFAEWYELWLDKSLKELEG